MDSTPVPTTTQVDMKALREGIRAKYHTYQRTDPDRFPDLDFNTNRVNYEPLRDSFEEEFYGIRGYSRPDTAICIPSTTTLSLLFTNFEYRPGRKILNTCYSYAEGPSQQLLEPVAPVHPQTEAIKNSKVAWFFVGMLVGTLSVGLVIAANRWIFTPKPSGLVIDRPTTRSTVRQELVVEGKARHTELVWLVVHPVNSTYYWVQPAVRTNINGYWIGVIFVGSLKESDVGERFQLRAFVNPKQELTLGNVLSDWPEAELSTPITEMVREPLTE